MHAHSPKGPAPFLLLDTDQLHDALFVIAEANCGLRALADLCRHYQGDDGIPFDPVPLAGLLDAIHHRIETAAPTHQPQD